MVLFFPLPPPRTAWHNKDTFSKPQADRLLEMGFQDEVNEIVKNCPKGRQTMLFSATMTDEVDDLVSLSLHEPVRLFIARNTEIASNLVQEFVRIRQTREVDRDAFLLGVLL